MGQHHTHQYGDISREHNHVGDVPDVHPPAKPYQQHMLRALGWHATIALAGGTLVLLGCVGFLSFLWFSDENNATWRAIIVNDWLTRSITITSLIIRWTVTVQAAAATSMIASLLLQHSEAPLSHAAAISLAVFANSGPHEILPCLPRARLDRMGRVFWALIIFSICTTTLLQFTSTALLSDVGIGTIEQPLVVSIAYGTEPKFTRSEMATSQKEAHGYLGTRPTVFSAFAEYTESAETRDGVSDTGLSMRAFLPLESQVQRERTISYRGKATLLDTRVVCVRPRFSGLQAQLPQLSEGSWISGSVWTDEKARRLKTSTESGELSGPLHFNCTFHKKRFGDGLPVARDEWVVSLCMDVQSGKTSQVGLVSDMSRTEVVSEAIVPGPLFLIINTTGTQTDWPVSGNIAFARESPGSSEWTTLPTNIRGVSFVMTLCSVDPMYQNTEVTVARPRGVTEPAITWASGSRMYNTQALRQQLGATGNSTSLAARGIYALEKKATWQLPRRLNATHKNSAAYKSRELTSAHLVADAAFEGLIRGVSTSSVNGSIPLCGFCGGSGAVLSRQYAAVFQDTLKATGSAAPAIQSLLTTLFTTSYHDRMYQHDVSAPADLAEETEVLRPTGRSLFVAVIILLGIHLTIATAVTVWFWRQTKDGNGMLVGASWAAIARVSGPQVDRWLVGAGRATDKEVVEAMKAGDTGDAMVGVAGDSERVFLRQRPYTART